MLVYFREAFISHSCVASCWSDNTSDALMPLSIALSDRYLWILRLNNLAIFSIIEWWFNLLISLIKITCCIALNNYCSQNLTPPWHFTKLQASILDARFLWICSFPFAHTKRGFRSVSSLMQSVGSVIKTKLDVVQSHMIAVTSFSLETGNWFIQWIGGISEFLSQPLWSL